MQAFLHVAPCLPPSNLLLPPLSPLPLLLFHSAAAPHRCSLVGFCRCGLSVCLSICLHVCVRVCASCECVCVPYCQSVAFNSIPISMTWGPPERERARPRGGRRDNTQQTDRERDRPANERTEQSTSTSRHNTTNVRFVSFL